MEGSRGLSALRSAVPLLPQHTEAAPAAAAGMEVLSGAPAREGPACLGEVRELSEGAAGANRPVSSWQKGAFLMGVETHPAQSSGALVLAPVRACLSLSDGFLYFSSLLPAPENAMELNPENLESAVKLPGNRTRLQGGGGAGRRLQLCVRPRTAH